MMNPKEQIKVELSDLLAYFPGRHRLSLVWLIILPVATTASAIDQSALWVYLPAAFVCLLRVNHSRRSSLQESGCIIVSSVLYGFLIGAPAIAVTVVWALSHVGLSMLTLLQGILGIMAVCVSVFLLVTILGIAAYYLGLFVPLFLLLVIMYVYFVPVSYSIDLVPQRWQTFYALVFPLAPEITIVRDAMLNSAASTQGLCWAAAAFTLSSALRSWLGCGKRSASQRFHRYRMKPRRAHLPAHTTDERR